MWFGIVSDIVRYIIGVLFVIGLFLVLIRVMVDSLVLFFYDRIFVF